MKKYISFEFVKSKNLFLIRTNLQHFVIFWKQFEKIFDKKAQGLILLQNFAYLKKEFFDVVNES